MSKTSPYIEFLARASVALTLVAQVPYELGVAATYLPPNIKEQVSKIGAFAALALYFVGGLLKMAERKNFTDTLKDQNIKTE